MKKSELCQFVIVLLANVNVNVKVQIMLTFSSVLGVCLIQQLLGAIRISHNVHINLSAYNVCTCIHEKESYR